MHTCLTLTNVGGHWYVEREVSGLIAAVRAYCDSIHIAEQHHGCCDHGGQSSAARLEACA